MRAIDNPTKIKPDANGHRTRFSDSSVYDEKCVLCGGTDASGDNSLNRPCPKAIKEEDSMGHYASEIDDINWGDQRETMQNVRAAKDEKMSDGMTDNRSLTQDQIDYNKGQMSKAEAYGKPSSPSLLKSFDLYSTPELCGIIEGCTAELRRRHNKLKEVI